MRVRFGKYPNDYIYYYYNFGEEIVSRDKFEDTKDKRTNNELQNRNYFLSKVIIVIDVIIWILSESNSHLQLHMCLPD
jgi:hypothetical protein